MLYLRICALDIELMERYFARWSVCEFSTMAFVGPLNAGTMLLPVVSKEPAIQLFPRICKIMHSLSARMPIAKYVLKGWEAALWARNFEIPGPARLYFDNLDTARDELTGVATSLIVTHVPEEETVLAEDWDDGELGFLLRKWNEMSLTA